MEEGWRYYNHVMIPACAPHESVNMRPLENGSIWKVGGKGNIALFARWTSDWDCDQKTDWWYVIKDDGFDIASLKAKRRYEINKGKKNFDVQEIVAEEYSNEIFNITMEAYKEYPAKYRPYVEKVSFINNLKSWTKYRVYGAFDRETDELCGYAYLSVHQNYVDFNCLKTMPKSEKKGINAAIVEKIVSDFNDKLCSSFYICDGSRALFHETNFQNYLEKYFGFRKAYCKLHIKYRGGIYVVVRVLYPIRKKLLGNGKLTSRIKTVLMYEEIKKQCMK